MKILFCGDIVGRAGRDAVLNNLPKLQKDLELDFVITNGDNAAGGFGITKDICTDLYKNGTDVITGGDHIWDQKSIINYIRIEKRLLRPYNFPHGTIGNGWGIYTAKNGKSILVLHLLGQVFHKENANCPFAAADSILEKYQIGKNIDVIFVDFHAEATSEKTAMGQYLAGRISAMIGSHTHIPTSDINIINGTAYQTDAGMCGDYNSVIGFEKNIPLKRFVNKLPKTGKMTACQNNGRLCGTYIEISNGFAVNIRQVMV